MRVGFQIKHFDPFRGGAETYVYRFVHHLVASGHEVHIFSQSFRDPPPDAVLHRLPCFTASRVQARVRSAQLDVIVGGADSLGMNVFQPHGGTFVGGQQQNIMLFRSGFVKKLRSLWYHAWPRPRSFLALERRQYAQQDPAPEIIAISQMVRRDMQRIYSVPDGRIHVVYNGVDTGEFSSAQCRSLRREVRHAWNIPEDTVCFLEVAHNFRLKGVRELIEALPLIPRSASNFRVVIAGRGNPRPYERLARRLGCNDRIQFVGPVSEPIRAFAAADAYLQPTWYDPCSLVVLEAWACALPVITTRFNGAGELMQDGREGFVLDTPLDSQGLAQRMLLLLDSRIRQTMGAAGRLLAEQHNMDRHLAQVMQVYEMAAQRNTVAHIHKLPARESLPRVSHAGAA